MTDLHWRRKVFAFKKESTYATDPTIAATDAMLTRGLQIDTYVGESIDRANDKIHFGNDDRVNVNPNTRVRFGVEIAGSGSAVDTPPAWSELMEACGMVETITASTSVGYAPDSGDVSNEFESGAGEFSLDGQMQQSLGMRGNVEIAIQQGQYPMFNFDLLGLFATPTAVALPSPDTTDFATALPVQNTNTPTVTLDGVAITLHSATLNLGNQLASRNYPNVGQQVIIADRRPSGQIMIEAPDLATKDWFAEIRSDNGVDNVALNIVHGTSANNIVTVACPVIQLDNMRLGPDNNGITTYTFDMIIKPSSGNDDLTITTT